ncbi:TIGR03749 family integrating conjugative element protein [Sedimenticola selenatireducens]|uniref:TIGR03749 family integrating conjugative element protein n=1 Tax=Sedimenticola selenatireducens TaxID=191960 RepID=UPI0004AEC310|nr:TIGR03749 family integrating conjugative element protein [Sedimenticola selenatireducens]
MRSTNARKSIFLTQRLVLWIGIGLLLIESIAHAEMGAIERIEWDKTPIRLDLKVGEERWVHFPGSVKVGLPASLQPLLRTQSVNGTVYFLASAPFDTTRIMLRTLDGGPLYLFDVSASETGGQSHPLRLFVKEAGKSREDPAAPPVARDVSTVNYSYVALTRFAAQQLYAPARLLRDLPGIVRVPVTRDPVSLLRGGMVDATPLVAWRAGGLFVTALKLTNRTDRPQILDPRDLRGTWLTATFQHNRLLAAGSEADTTAVYLISARPFAASR